MPAKHFLDNVAFLPLFQSPPPSPLFPAIKLTFCATRTLRFFPPLLAAGVSGEAEGVMDGGEERRLLRGYKQ